MRQILILSIVPHVVVLTSFEFAVGTKVVDQLHTSAYTLCRFKATKGRSVQGVQCVLRGL